MKILFTLLLALIAFTGTIQAQKTYATRNGKISFISTDDDDIQAVNNEVTSRLAAAGDISFSLLMKGFRFESQEMQDHFNNTYLESDKYPRADFKGSILNNREVNYAKNGFYPVTVKGVLTIHGVSQEMTTKGELTIKDGKPGVMAKFRITLEQFHITGGLLKAITKGVNITVDCHY